MLKLTDLNDLHNLVSRAKLHGHHRSVIMAAAFSLIAYRLYHMWRRPRMPKLKGPPSESLVFGATRRLFDAHELGAIYQEWEKAYGAMYQIPASLGTKMLIVSDPKALTHVFSRDTFAYHQPQLAKTIAKRSFGNILVMQEGEDHKRQRKALSPAFSVAAIRNLTSVFLGCAYRVKSAWDELFESRSGPTDSLIIDVQKWINYISIDSLGTGGFSHNFGALQGHRSPITDGLDSFGDVKPSLLITSLFLIGPLFPGIFSRIPTPRKKRNLMVSRGVREIAGTLLERAEMENAMGIEGVEKSIIGTLVKSESASANIQLSIDEIMAQINMFMIAGYETTSVSITWALIELCRHPEIQEALRAELRQHLAPGEDPTYDQLVNSLPYLDALTSEVLRMHPAVCEVTREAVEDDIIPLAHPLTTASGDVIESLFVPKGTVVRLPLIGVNRSEALWGPDSGSFNPERWLVPEGDSKAAARKEEIQGYKHLSTFAFGPRMCLGRTFALTEFKIVISVFIRNFTFELPNGPETVVESHRSILPRPKIAGEEGPKVPLVVRRITTEEK